MQFTSEDIGHDRADPFVISHHAWSYFTLNLDSTAKTSFGQVAFGNGAEAWRKLVQPIRSQTELRRQQLRSRIQQPNQATDIKHVSNYTHEWESVYLEYLECGGTPMSNEELKASFLRLLRNELLYTLERTVLGSQCPTQRHHSSC